MTPSTAAAPDRLEVVRQFVNTWDIEASVDVLDAPDALARWLDGVSLAQPGIQVGDAELQRALDLREALRQAMAANHSMTPVPREAVATINEAAGRGGLTLVFTPESSWVPQSASEGVDAALGALLAIAVQAAGDGTWRRLKVCVNDTCRWAFYDHSRARSGKWCSMQVCGNRVKQQAWRLRQDSERSSRPPRLPR